jgi:hypothetical protein
VGNGGTAPCWGDPLPEAIHDRRMDARWQDRHGVPLEVRRPMHRRPGDFNLLRLTVAAMVCLAEGAPVRAGREGDSRKSAVLAAAAAARRFFRRAAGQLALLGETVEALPGRVDASRAVRTAPEAGSRQEPCDQEGHEQRQHGCQSGRPLHRFRVASRRERDALPLNYTDLTRHCHPGSVAGPFNLPARETATARNGSEEIAKARKSEERERHPNEHKDAKTRRDAACLCVRSVSSLRAFAISPIPLRPSLFRAFAVSLESGGRREIRTMPPG